MYLSLGKNKKETFSLNLNVYRNAHFYKLNAAKVKFKELVRPMIEQLPQLNCCGILYEVYAPTSREFDINNVCSVVDKFFCDALVELGKLPDDNYKHLTEITSRFGGIDKTNPRVDVTIYPKEETNMKITVTVERKDILAIITERSGIALDGDVALVITPEGDITVSVTPTTTTNTTTPPTTLKRAEPVKAPKKALPTKVEVTAEVVEEGEDDAPFEDEAEPLKEEQGEEPAPSLFGSEKPKQDIATLFGKKK